MSDPEKSALLSKRTMERIPMPHIQGLRFVAMAWIVLYHYLDFDHNSVLGTFVLSRPLDLFTVISGFVTHLAYSRKEDIGGPVSFLVRRTSKVAFMYHSTLFIAFFIKICTMGMQEVGMDKVVEAYTAYFCNVLGVNVWFSVVIPFYSSVAEMPPLMHFLAKYVYPFNGPLWYIQTLAFCWATYPLVRGWISGMSRRAAAHWIFALGLISVFPAVLVLTLTSNLTPWFTFLKVFPPFMLPSFYLGAVVYELFLDEISKPQTDSEPVGEEESLWHAWATLSGEGLFAVFLVLVVVLSFTVPGHEAVGLLRMHMWCVIFGFILWFFAVSAHHNSKGASDSGSVGLKWALDSDFLGMLGDASLFAFTVQCPLNMILYFLTVEDGIKDPVWRHTHWMGGLQFSLFFVLLYVISIYGSRYIDKPATAAVSNALGEGMKSLKHW